MVYKKCVLSAVVLILCSHSKHAELQPKPMKKKVYISVLRYRSWLKLQVFFRELCVCFLFSLFGVVVHWCFHTTSFFPLSRCDVCASARVVFSHSHRANQQRKKAFDLCSLPRFCRCSWDFALSFFSVSFIWVSFHYFYFHSSIVLPIYRFCRHILTYARVSECVCLYGCASLCLSWPVEFPKNINFILYSVRF